MSIAVEVLVCLSEIIDEDLVVVTSCCQIVGIDFDSAYLLSMISGEGFGDGEGSAVVSFDRFIFGTSVDIFLVPLDTRYSLLVMFE